MKHKWQLSLHKNAKILVAEDRKGPLETKCWEIISHKPGHEGRVSALYKGKKKIAARIVYLIEKGDIPGRKVVMHICDNPLCVNPDHLKLGTHKENTQDMINKNRHKHGEAASWSKLSITAIRFIRELKYKPGIFAALSVILEVSEATIRDAFYGRTWKYDT